MFPFPTIPPSIQYSVGISDTDVSQTGTDIGDTVTFTAMTAGNERSDRLLIAAIHFRDNTSDVTFTRSVTIGGISATEITFTGVGGSGTSYVAIWAAVVPTGVTVDVVATFTGFSGTIDQWGCTLIRATGLLSTTELATATENSAGGNDGILTLDNTGAKFAVVIVGDLNNDLSARTPTSSSGSSTIVLGHQMNRGLVYIDITPPNTTVDYTIDSYSGGNPDLIAAACWG